MANISKIKLPDNTTYDINALYLGGQEPSYYNDFNNLENFPEILTLQTQLTSIGTSASFSSTDDNQLPTSLAVKNFVEGKGYTTNTGTVTSVRVQAGTGLNSSQSTAQTSTLNTTISIASGYKLPTTTEWSKVRQVLVHFGNITGSSCDYRVIKNSVTQPGVWANNTDNTILLHVGDTLNIYDNGGEYSVGDAFADSGDVHDDVSLPLTLTDSIATIVGDNIYFSFSK